MHTKVGNYMMEIFITSASIVIYWLNVNLILRLHSCSDFMTALKAIAGIKGTFQATNRPIVGRMFWHIAGYMIVVGTFLLREMEKNALELEEKGSNELEKQEFSDLDKILPYVGELGKYQMILIAMLALMILTAGFPVLIMFFAAQNPPWTCVANSTICKLNGSFTVKEPEYEKRCNMPRSEWKFTKPESYSIVTQFDIHCGTEYYIYLSTSLLFIGWGIGSVIFGWLADRYGRFKVLVVSVVGIILVTFLSAFSPNYPVFAVSRLVVGIFKPGTVVGAYIVAGELVGPKYRPLAGTIMWILFAISLVLTGVKAYFVREWKTLVMICSAPYAFVFLFFFYIPESMRWLRLNGRHADAVAILRKAATVNGKVLPDGLELTSVSDSVINKAHSGVLALFRPLKMLMYTSVQGFSWFVSAVVYYGVSLAVSSLSGEMYRDYILATLIEIPALICSVFLMNRLGRKKAVIAGMVVGGVFCIIVGGLSSVTKEKQKLKILSVLFGLSGKFCITLSFNSLYMWSMELYPTSIRGEGMGFVQITSRVGSALAPWVARWLGVFHAAIPFSLMGGLSIISGATLVLLPETGNQKTLETVDDLIGCQTFKSQDKLIANGKENSASV